MTKSNYLEKFSFYLSFYFTEEDREGILCDYEEWFSNELASGKAEIEICAGLASPGKLARKIYKEAGMHGKSPFSILMHNTRIKAFLLIFFHFLLSALLLYFCNDHIYNYFYSALGLNLATFIAALFLVGKKNCHEFKKRQKDFFFAIFPVALLFLQIYIFPKYKNPLIGRYYSIFFEICAFIILLTSLYLIRKKEDESVFINLIILSGTVSMICFLINQLNVRYHSPKEVTYNIYANIGIYLETLVLCFLFSVLFRTLRRNSWTLS